MHAANEASENPITTHLHVPTQNEPTSRQNFAFITTHKAPESFTTHSMASLQQISGLPKSQNCHVLLASWNLFFTLFHTQRRAFYGPFLFANEARDSQQNR